MHTNEASFFYVSLLSTGSIFSWSSPPPLGPSQFSPTSPLLNSPRHSSSNYHFYCFSLMKRVPPYNLMVCFVLPELFYCFNIFKYLHDPFVLGISQSTYSPKGLEGNPAAGESLSSPRQMDRMVECKGFDVRGKKTCSNLSPSRFISCLLGKWLDSKGLDFHEDD